MCPCTPTGATKLNEHIECLIGHIETLEAKLAAEHNAGLSTSLQGHEINLE